MKRSTTKWNEKQLEIFWFWINERHRIYRKKLMDKPWPWTKDKILQEYKFTNVFRQLDRVTDEWTKRFVNLLGRGKDMKDGDLLFHCAMFRLFNWPQTYDALYYGMSKWKFEIAMAILDKIRDEKKQIFTGAYIIPNGGRTDPKIQVICEALDELFEQRMDFAARIRKRPSMRRTCNILQNIPTVGPFIAYEIACDLRHTRLLHDAYDVGSWANPGPGAKRGINRLLTGKRRIAGAKPDYIALMRELLVLSKRNIRPHIVACEWPFEMREIEHSLCEFDKYMRVKNKEGRPRSKYHYEPQKELPF